MTASVLVQRQIAPQGAERQLTFLASARDVLATARDSADILSRIPWIAVPDLADWCAVYLMDSDHRPRLATFACGDPSDAGLAYALEQAPPLVDSHSSLVLSSAWPHWDSLSVQSQMHLPMRARGRTLGLMALLATGNSGCHYAPADIRFAQRLADDCAIALDNALLADELRRALGVREELLAATSHELRTPLAHIKGFASSLRHPDLKWDEATRDDFLEEIEREADRLADLIDDLFTMSHLETDASAQQVRVPISPAALVSAGLDRVRGVSHCARVDLDVESNLPTVCVDAPQFIRVIANLVENAMKHGCSHPHIRITARVTDGDLEIVVRLPLQG